MYLKLLSRLMWSWRQYITRKKIWANSLSFKSYECACHVRWVWFYPSSNKEVSMGSNFGGGWESFLLSRSFLFHSSSTRVNTSDNIRFGSGFFIIWFDLGLDYCHIGQIQFGLGFQLELFLFEFAFNLLKFCPTSFFCKEDQFLRIQFGLSLVWVSLGFMFNVS